MKKQYDILVAGEICPDLILSDDINPVFGQAEILINSATLTIGSSSVIFACGAAKLGLSVGFIGVCGDDLFGNYMLTEMSKLGIDTSPVIIRHEGKTGISIILTHAKNGDRAILTFPGLIPTLTADDVHDNLLESANHLHVGSYFLQTALQPDLSKLFQKAKSFGLTTSLDPNWDPSCEWKNFDDLLNYTDVFYPNENEALALTRTTKIESAMEILSKKCKIVVSKLGKKGAIAHDGLTTANASALTVQIVDTVGAGDSFDAGFTYGFLHGWSLERSLRLGTICGSLSTRHAGGTSAQPTLEETEIYGI